MRASPFLAYSSLLVLVAALAGCASTPQRALLDIDVPADVLSGVSLFGEPVHIQEAPAVDLLAVDAAMRDFLADEVGMPKSRLTRFKRLYRALADAGYFAAVYVPNQTHTAAQTFAARAGNCLSYTAMFAALARALELPVAFQIVDVPPSWDADSGTMIRYTHINLLMEGVKLQGTTSNQLVVDFNEIHPEKKTPGRIVTDHTVASLYHANRGVELYLGPNQRLGFAHLLRAIHMDPANTDFWANLGAFYAKSGHWRESLHAYRASHRLDRSNKVALSGLARGYARLGEQQLAAKYERRVRDYRDNHPFYHFAVARSRYEGERFDQALVAIRRAIALERRNPRFHFLKGLTEYRLGDVDAARISFRRAHRFGNYDDLKHRYLPELAQSAAERIVN